MQPRSHCREDKGTTQKTIGATTMPRQTEEEKFQELIDNYTNGNISDFREAIQRMRKAKLARLIQYADEGNQADAKRYIYKVMQ